MNLSTLDLPKRDRSDYTDLTSSGVTRFESPTTTPGPPNPDSTGVLWIQGVSGSRVGPGRNPFSGRRTLTSGQRVTTSDPWTPSVSRFVSGSTTVPGSTV